MPNDIGKFGKIRSFIHESQWFRVQCNKSRSLGSHLLVFFIKPPMSSPDKKFFWQGILLHLGFYKNDYHKINLEIIRRKVNRF